MKTTFDLKSFKASRAKLPNGGAILTVHSGKICSPMMILEEFPSTLAAERALSQAGFARQSGHQWK